MQEARQITRADVQSLLGLFKHGLVGGAGSTTTEFCVQQAVHRVVEKALKKQKSASPPKWCVHHGLVGFGVTLNDHPGWHSNASRAKGLAKFAIAELGSSKISYTGFSWKLNDRLEKLSGCSPGALKNNSSDVNPELFAMEMRGKGVSENAILTLFANTAAEVLKEMGTDGGKWIHLVDEPNKRKRRELARKLGKEARDKQHADWKKRMIKHRLGRPYSSQVASTGSSFGRTAPITKVPLH